MISCLEKNKFVFWGETILIQCWYVTWYWYELIVWISIGPAIWRNSFAILEIFFQVLSTSWVLVSTLDQGWESEMILRKFIRENFIFRQGDPLRMKSRFLLMQKVDFQILQSEKRPIYSDKEWNKGRPLGEIRLRLILIIQVQPRFLDSLFIAVPSCFVAKH